MPDSEAHRACKGNDVLFLIANHPAAGPSIPGLRSNLGRSPLHDNSGTVHFDMGSGLPRLTLSKPFPDRSKTITAYCQNGSLQVALSKTLRPRGADRTPTLVCRSVSDRALGLIGHHRGREVWSSDRFSLLGWRCAFSATPLRWSADESKMRIQNCGTT